MFGSVGHTGITFGLICAQLWGAEGAGNHGDATGRRWQFRTLESENRPRSSGVWRRCATSATLGRSNALDYPIIDAAERDEDLARLQITDSRANARRLCNGN